MDGRNLCTLIYGNHTLCKSLRNGKANEELSCRSFITLIWKYTRASQVYAYYRIRNYGARRTLLFNYLSHAFALETAILSFESSCFV